MCPAWLAGGLARVCLKLTHSSGSWLGSFAMPAWSSNLWTLSLVVVWHKETSGNATSCKSKSQQHLQFVVPHQLPQLNFRRQEKLFFLLLFLLLRSESPAAAGSQLLIISGSICLTLSPQRSLRLHKLFKLGFFLHPLLLDCLRMIGWTHRNFRNFVFGISNSES